MKQTSPTILTPTQWTTLDKINAMAYGGKRRGTPAGTHVTDLSALKKTIVLCGGCQSKFDWRRHGYYSVWRYEHQPVLGQCDGCRGMISGNDGRLFLHESSRAQAWATPDEQRRMQPLGSRLR